MSDIVETFVKHPRETVAIMLWISVTLAILAAIRADGRKE